MLFVSGKRSRAGVARTFAGEQGAGTIRALFARLLKGFADAVGGGGQVGFAQRGDRDGLAGRVDGDGFEGGVLGKLLRDLIIPSLGA
jgi:hypothetical protein